MLRDSEAKYKTLVQYIDVIVWEANLPEFEFTFVSNHAEKMLGYPAHEWHKSGFWLSKLYPEDRDEIYIYFLDVSQRDEDYDIDYRMVSVDGSIV